MPSQDITTGESITVTCKAPTPGAAASSGASWKNVWGLFGSSKPAAAPARDTVQGEARVSGGKRNKNKKGTKKGGMKKGGKKSKTSKRSKRG